ncbi:hypothetical protein [Xanthomarina gelatinilytica]|uniref:hypothetical protein n=1 Tax=Xanthomarina gelatinilytica TaxID=1137281 RepID=UPI003AA96723
MGFFEKNGSLAEFSELVTEFIDSPSKGLEIFVTPELEEDRTRNNILKYVSYLNTTLKDVNTDLISDYTYVQQLHTLNKTINELLENID